MNFRHSNNNRSTNQNSKRGNALLMTIVIFLVISIFAVAVMALSMTEFNLAKADENFDQAYYVARSAANATMQWVAAYSNHDNLDNVVNAPASTGTIDGYSYTTVVTKDGSNRITITSRAKSLTKFTSAEASAAVSFYINNSAYILFEDAIYSSNAFIDNSGNNQSINVHSGTVSTGHEGYSQEEINLLDARFFDSDNPTGVLRTGYAVGYNFKEVHPDLNTTVITDYINALGLPDEIIPNGTVRPISQNTHFQNLEIAGGKLLIDNTTAAGDIHITIDNLTISQNGSSIDLVNKNDNPTLPANRVFIYVDKTINWVTNRSLFIADATSTGPSLVFFIINGINANSDDATIPLSGNSNLYAYIYSPHEITYMNGDISLHGAIIASTFTWSGGIDVYYSAPNLVNSPFQSLIDENELTVLKGITWSR